MSSRAALHLVLSLCLLPLSGACRGLMGDGRPTAIPVSGTGTAAAEETVQEASSWTVPDVDPCALVTRIEAEAVMGPLKGEPRRGGTAADGIGCTYVGADPLVVTLGVISTNTFELRKSDAGNATAAGIGGEAYTAKPNALGDIYLFARKGEAAVMINVTVGAGDDVRDVGRHAAEVFARKALDRLLVREK